MKKFLFCAALILGFLLFGNEGKAVTPSKPTDTDITGLSVGTIMWPTGMTKDFQDACAQCYLTISEGMVADLGGCTDYAKAVNNCTQICALAGNVEALTDLQNQSKQCLLLLINNPIIQTGGGLTAD